MSWDESKMPIYWVLLETQYVKASYEIATNEADHVEIAKKDLRKKLSLKNALIWKQATSVEGWLPVGEPVILSCEISPSKCGWREKDYQEGARQILALEDERILAEVLESFNEDPL
jgi:hypothetical protein